MAQLLGLKVGLDGVQEFQFNSSCSLLFAAIWSRCHVGHPVAQKTRTSLVQLRQIGDGDSMEGTYICSQGTAQ
jgi:hypothetical protein